MFAVFGIGALVVNAVCLSGVAFAGLGMMRKPVPLANLTFAALLAGLLAFASLATAFLVSDFSLKLVAEHSHTAKPVFYKFSGSWGNHEGSMLLWVVVATAYLHAFARWSYRTDTDRLPFAVGVLALAIIPITLFVLTLSSPFTRLAAPYPLEGSGLNPILQDVGLAIHPPVLYLGYVGLMVPWAIAVAAMLKSWEARGWASLVKGWIYLPLAFLTAGIALGSWWAYRELGWGGWWFWDPVENVSLLPWLIAVGLLHSVSVTLRNGSLSKWSYALAILAFASTILGTFLVRSGLLVSVHAFAASPDRGIAILAYFALLTGFGLYLVASRPDTVSDSNYEAVSRAMSLRIQNLLIVAISVAVFAGTVYPPLFQAFGLAPIAVGAPYYAVTAVPILVASVALMAVAPSLSWRSGVIPSHRRILIAVGALALLAAGIMMYSSASVWSALGLAAGGGALVASIWQYVASKRNGRAHQWARTVSHFGVSVFTIAVAFNTAFVIEGDVEIENAGSVSIGSHTLIMTDLMETPGPNYMGVSARIFVDGKIELLPEYRFYPVRQQPTTEADIHTNLFRDFRASLNLIEAGGDVEVSRWAVRFHRQPAMIWLWIGALLIAFGLLIAARDSLARA